MYDTCKASSYLMQISSKSCWFGRGFRDIWCKELTHWKRPWCWERLKAKREGGGRGWDGWIASLTQWHKFQQTLGDGGGQGSLEYCSPWGHKSQTRLSDWTSMKTATTKKARVGCFQLFVGLDGWWGGSVFIECLQQAWESEGIPTALVCCILCRIWYS